MPFPIKGNVRRSEVCSHLETDDSRPGVFEHSGPLLLASEGNHTRNGVGFSRGLPFRKSSLAGERSGRLPSLRLRSDRLPGLRVDSRESEKMPRVARRDCHGITRIGCQDGLRRQDSIPVESRRVSCRHTCVPDCCP